jgi:hypothetical protein
MPSGKDGWSSQVLTKGWEVKKRGIFRNAALLNPGGAKTYPSPLGFT